MGWNIDNETWVDKLNNLTSLIDNMSYRYFELFEPTKLNNLIKKLGEIQDILSKDEDAGKRALCDLTEIWQGEIDRISVPASQKDIKSLHATREQLKIGELKYRDILLGSTGKSSSRGMTHGEAMIALRALHSSNKDLKQ